MSFQLRAFALICFLLAVLLLWGAHQLQDQPKPLRPTHPASFNRPVLPPTSHVWTLNDTEG